jgi:general secretion pathway protein E/type IV pilus assembly protein PilB
MLRKIDPGELDTALLQLITTEQAWHYSIIPKSANNDSLEFYIDASKHIETTREEMEILLGKKIDLVTVESESIHHMLGKHYRKGNIPKQRIIQDFCFTPHSDDFLINLISSSNSLGSSDIHIEIFEEKCRVRLRIDGKLIERYVLTKTDYPAIINRIKIKANLDISEKRLPQDGRIFFNQDNEKFDIRVSVLPTIYGEKIVMRLLSKDAADIDIHKLGFTTEQLKDYLEAILRPNGIILISGPTGSGKTTTLYATLRILNKESSNIVTIEDPIEYTLEGVNQVQLKESIGLSFATALRTFLRQDPDIIMLGEIRDGETAQMAIRAALTGHLVLSTIHTNSAWGTISRLIDMGVPPFLIADTMNCTIAQRLVRVLCTHCKQEVTFNENLLPRNYRPKNKLLTHYIAVGCKSCFFSGYLGRKALYEVILIDHELITLMKAGSNVDEILKKKKIKSLSDVAFEMIESGITSIDECYSLLKNQD